MSYLSIVEMASSPSLQSRITAALADEGYEGDPTEFVRTHIWEIVAKSTEWATNWQYAVEQSTVNDNPDTGVRNDVISDAMILSVVQPMVNPELQELAGGQ